MFSVKREDEEYRKVITHIGRIPKVIPLKLFLDVFGLRKSLEGLGIANNCYDDLLWIIILNENMHATRVVTSRRKRDYVHLRKTPTVMRD